MIGFLSFHGVVLSAGCLALAACLGYAPLTLAQDAPPSLPVPGDAAAAPDPNPDPNVEVLTRGPVHEAYAIPVNTGRTAGLIVPKKPSDPIEEAPPEVKPEGDDAIWIPGYWSWDDDRKDFIWVSGVWRVPPPGYRWVPGYWQEGQGGWQWVSGLWMQDGVQEVQYLAQPPESLDQGPSSPQPGDNYVWAPGAWRWQETRYVWAPGYWIVAQPEWVYVPPTYYWTPRGWVHVPGYWDYPLARRGLLFSPVYFVRPVAVYRPAVCVDVGVLTFSLFARPAYCHYYFGDYYGDNYAVLGIRPWFHYHHRDPLYSYYRWHYHHHGDPHWERHLHGWHDYYRKHPDMRPPHTLAAQQVLLSKKDAHRRPDYQKLSIAQPVSHLKSNPKAFVKVQNVSVTQQTVIKQSVKQTVVFQQGRRQLETKGVVAGAGATAGKLPGAGPKGPDKANFSKLPDFHATQLQGKASGGATAAKITPGKLPSDRITSGKGPAGKITAGKVEKGTVGSPAEGIAAPGAKRTVKPPPLPDAARTGGKNADKATGSTFVRPKTEPKIQPKVQPKIQSVLPTPPSRSTTPGTKEFRSGEGRQPKFDRSDLRSGRERSKDKGSRD